MTIEDCEVCAICIEKYVIIVLPCSLISCCIFVGNVQKTTTRVSITKWGEGKTPPKEGHIVIETRNEVLIQRLSMWK